MTTTSSTLIVDQFFSQTGSLIQDSLPLLWLWMGIGLALIALGIIIKAVIGILKKVGR